ncbi:hypothetical protein H6G26_36345 [Nostoc sp. FACHB-888]|nr:hypothetical protein [Nostoc sp. FACHB-888]
MPYFIKTTNNYWYGLFHCYEIEDFPRTNNDLEHIFGMLRHHQPRCTGRKVAPSSLVIRGSVKLACAIAYGGILLAKVLQTHKQKCYN